MIEKPYVVLGKYYPSRWKSWVVGPELCRLTQEWGLVPHPDPHHGPLRLKTWYDVKKHAEVRVQTLSSPKAYRGEQWHQDGDLNPESKMDCALVTWSNVEPTQYQYKGRVYQPQPFELVITRNLGCLHRRPPEAPKHRWLFRQRVRIPTHFSLP